MELTDRAIQHIQKAHPEILPKNLGRLRVVLAEPDLVRRSRSRPQVVLLSRWYDDLLMGKYLVAVVDVADPRRPRVLTSYATRKPGIGEVLWRRS